MNKNRLLSSFINSHYSRMPLPLKDVVRLVLHFIGRYRRKIFSQEGEDALLARLLEGKDVGFYVDVGAHHPSSCSNTYYFYKKGWHGINIDAMPGSMRLFNLVRSRDTNLEMAISEKEGFLEFHSFNNPLFNSADKELYEERRTEFNEPANSHNVFHVKANTLEYIFSSYLPPGTEIDFLTIDVEGLDFQVLKSNDWEKYRPKYVLVEILGQSISSLSESEIYAFLIDKGYVLVSKLVHTVVFMEKSEGGIGYR